MKKEQYKKVQSIKRIRTKYPDLSLRAANAVLKLMKALGPMPKAKRKKLLEAASILVNYED